MRNHGAGLTSVTACATEGNKKQKTMTVRACVRGPARACAWRAGTLQQRAGKLRLALDAHSKNTARSAKGQGFDRHLLVGFVVSGVVD